MQSRYEGFMVTDPATRYGEGPPGAVAGEMPGAADADVDGAAPTACRAGGPLVTTTAPTATAITAAATASGARTRQRRPGITAGDTARSGEFAALFRARSFTPASVTAVRRPPAWHGNKRGTAG